MRLARLAAATALLLAPAAASAGLFGRSKFDSRWAAKPMPVNGDDADWNESSAFEEDGLSVLAMNDASDLYLIVTAHTRDGREQLSGEARQDVTLFFLNADGKSRQWGAKLPFTRRGPLTEALRDPAGVDPEPEYVSFQGAAVSTSPWPADLQDRLASEGRRPIWELKIPRSRLALGPEGTVLFDFEISDPKGGARKRTAQPAPVAHKTEGDGDDAGAVGRRGKGRQKESSEGGYSSDVLQGAEYTLTVRLAHPPGAP